jgi:hypothetical protein
MICSSPTNNSPYLEPKSAKEDPEKPDDLEGDLKNPENSELILRHRGEDQWETEFPIPGEPKDPDLPRAPAAFEDN